MNNLYASGRPGLPVNALPPGARPPGTLQPPNRHGQQLGGPSQQQQQQQADADYRLAPSYQAGGWQSNGAGFPPQHMLPMTGGVYPVQQSMPGYPAGRPPPPPPPQQQQQQPPRGQAGGTGGSPHSSDRFFPQPGGNNSQYNLPLPYMGNLGVWGGDDGRQQHDQDPQRDPQQQQPHDDDHGAHGAKSAPKLGAGAAPVAVKTEDDDAGPAGAGGAGAGGEVDDDKVDHRKRKRNRTIRSCVPCHNHKRKCDRKRPCGRCTALGLTGSCVYEVDEARDPNDPDVVETDRLRRRIAELEQVVRELRQRHPPRGQAAAAAAAAAAASSAAPTRAEDKRQVLVDRYARFKIGEAAAYMGEGSAGAPSLHSASPSTSDARDYSEPYNPNALPSDEMHVDNAGRKTFLGTPAGKPMLRRLREIVHGRSQLQQNDEIMTVPEDLAFTGWFANARKTFPFTTIWSHDNFIDEIVDLLPNKADSELLLTSFHEEINLLFEAWHVPSLHAEFRHFFALSRTEKRNQPLSHLALYIMICSLGCMVRAASTEIMGDSDKDSTGRKDLTGSRLQSELYLSAAYQALRLCSFLSTPTIHTLQAQILINVYLLHSERAADSWALVGSLVRQCIAMGLHIEPTHVDPRISMREAEVRRRVWWSVAGLETLLCVSFGRPSCINYYTCLLPQDHPEDWFSDAPGSAVTEAPSNALATESGENTYHAAYFQITLPSLELLNRTFHVSPLVARNSFMGWFTSPDREDTIQPPTVVGNTYEDAIRLGCDIFDWYSHIPYGMRYDVDMPLEDLTKRSRRDINQSLALCVKTLILVLILHRPYLRSDPCAYPESAKLCGEAAHKILRAYSTMVKTKASIAWSWWTMSYRAFHAATVCAFLAIREPATPLAERCLVDLRGAITIFEDRTADWMVSHPVQSDLCGGLVRLEKLAHAAVQQSPIRPLDAQPKPSPVPVFPALGSDPSLPIFSSGLASLEVPIDGLGFPFSPHNAAHPSRNGSPPDANNNHNNNDHPHESRRPSGPFLQPWSMPQQELYAHSLFGSGAEGGHLPQMSALGGNKDDGQPDLVQIWASMFNIKMDPEHGQSSSLPRIMPPTNPPS